MIPSSNRLRRHALIGGLSSSDPYFMRRHAWMVYPPLKAFFSLRRHAWMRVLLNVSPQASDRHALRGA